MCEPGIRGDPIFFSSWRICRTINTSGNSPPACKPTSPQSQDVLDADIFRSLGTSASHTNTARRELHTLRASSTDPCSILVQVRCITVSIPYSFCVSDARSSVWFLVDPPAPHVILIARGFRSARREIRKSRLLNPWIRFGPHQGSILRYLGSPVRSGVGRTRKCRRALELAQTFRPTSFRDNEWIKMDLWAGGQGLTRYGLHLLQIAPW